MGEAVFIEGASMKWMTAALLALCLVGVLYAESDRITEVYSDLTRWTSFTAVSE